MFVAVWKTGGFCCADIVPRSTGPGAAVVSPEQMFPQVTPVVKT